MPRRCLATFRPKRWRVSSRRRRPPSKDSNGSSAGAIRDRAAGHRGLLRRRARGRRCRAVGVFQLRALERPAPRDREIRSSRRGSGALRSAAPTGAAACSSTPPRHVLDFAFDHRRRASARSARGGGERARQRRAAQDRSGSGRCAAPVVSSRRSVPRPGAVVDPRGGLAPATRSAAGQRPLEFATERRTGWLGHSGMPEPFFCPRADDRTRLPVIEGKVHSTGAC